MRVLFVVPYAPSQIRSRSYHLIRTLVNQGHRLTVATLWRDEREHGALVATLNDVEAVVGKRVSPWRSMWNVVRALPTGDPVQAHFSWHAGLARTLAELVRETRFDVVHVEHLRGARYAMLLADALSHTGAAVPAVVWDSVDCISDLFRHAAARGRHRAVRWVARLELPRTERFEGGVVSRFSRVLVTSAADREGLLQLAARRTGRQDSALATRVVVLPNGVDLERFAPTSRTRESATIVMSGKMSYHANVAAAIRFADDVLPRIHQQRPDVRFIVVGQNPPRIVRRLAGRSGISVTGTVDDVRPYLQSATLAVAPIEYGVGIQNKILEAFACGTPVVATATAVQALGVRAGRELAVADGPDAFARTVLNLLDAPEERSRLGRAGREYVEAHHCWSAVGRQLAHLYGDAAA